MHRRIKFYLLRYQRKFGESPEIRKQNTLRNILTFTALPAIDQCVKKSKTIIKIFMEKQLKDFEMKSKFKIPSLAAQKIK